MDNVKYDAEIEAILGKPFNQYMADVERLQAELKETLERLILLYIPQPILGPHFLLEENRQVDTYVNNPPPVEAEAFMDFIASKIIFKKR